MNTKPVAAIVSVEELLTLASRLQRTDRYISLKEVCELTGFSKRTIQKAKGLPRYRPFDGALRFRLSEVHAFMQRHAETVEPEQQDAFIEKMKRTIAGGKK